MLIVRSNFSRPTEQTENLPAFISFTAEGDANATGSSSDRCGGGPGRVRRGQDDQLGVSNGSRLCGFIAPGGGRDTERLGDADGGAHDAGSGPDGCRSRERGTGCGGDSSGGDSSPGDLLRHDGESGARRRWQRDRVCHQQSTEYPHRRDASLQDDDVFLCGHHRQFRIWLRNLRHRAPHDRIHRAGEHHRRAGNLRNGVHASVREGHHCFLQS